MSTATCTVYAVQCLFEFYLVIFPWKREQRIHLWLETCSVRPAGEREREKEMGPKNPCTRLLSPLYSIILAFSILSLLHHEVSFLFANASVKTEAGSSETYVLLHMNPVQGGIIIIRIRTFRPNKRNFCQEIFRYLGGLSPPTVDPTI